MGLQFDENHQIQFIANRHKFMTGSAILCALIVIGISIFGFNWGVDFAGGSEIEIKFDGAVDVTAVRKAVESAGFKSPIVQEVGSSDDNTLLVRIGQISTLTQADADKARAAVAAKFGDDISSFDFNPNYGDKFEIRFKKGRSAANASDGLRAAVEGTGISVQDIRNVADGFSVITSGIADKVSAALESRHLANQMPKAELHRVEFVGPQVGKQLRNQGILAVLYTAAAILLYIAFRFELRFAPGAVIALLHDVIIVLGYFLITRREFNLTSVSVLLTIVGYSVNDTIVIYDRIRENVSKYAGRNLADVMNLSINQTLGRTILTSATTIISVLGLIVFGVGQLFDFAMAMILGIITGSYSSIFVAIPLSLFFEKLGKGQDKKGESASQAIVSEAGKTA